MNTPVKNGGLLPIIILLAVVSGCLMYSRVAPPEGLGHHYSGKIAVLHHGQQEQLMDDLVLHPDHLEGVYRNQITRLSGSTANPHQVPRRVRTREKVHIYLNRPVTEFGTNGNPAKIPFANMETIEVYKTDGKSAIYTIGNAALLAGVGYLVAVVLVAIFKSSCPFIYVDTPQGTAFAGEIFSGAVFPQIERHDYLRIPTPDTTGGQYTLFVTNEVREIQHINLMELFVVDHQIGTAVLADKYGSLHLISNPQPPVSATNTAGEDILERISGRDSLAIVTGAGQPDDAIPVEMLVLQFLKPAGIESGRLVIRAKNSNWLDYSYMAFHDQLGNWYERWLKKQEKESAKEIEKWSMDQKIPLCVLIDRMDTSEYIDYFNIAGPMAMKDDVLPIDLSGVSGDTVTIRLETGFLFWEIDYVAMDFTLSDNFRTRVMEPSYALDLDAVDIRPLISGADTSYYTMGLVGDEAQIEFPVPYAVPGHDRTVILHSKGYYDILMDPPDFRPNPMKLKKLRDPLHFTQFSWNYYNRTMAPEKVH